MASSGEQSFEVGEIVIDLEISPSKERTEFENNGEDLSVLETEVLSPMTTIKNDVTDVFSFRTNSNPKNNIQAITDQTFTHNTNIKKNSHGSEYIEANIYPNRHFGYPTESEETVSKICTHGNKNDHDTLMKARLPEKVGERKHETETETAYETAIEENSHIQTRDAYEYKAMDQFDLTSQVKPVVMSENETDVEDTFLDDLLKSNSNSIETVAKQIMVNVNEDYLTNETLVEERSLRLKNKDKTVINTHTSEYLNSKCYQQYSTRNTEANVTSSIEVTHSSVKDNEDFTEESIPINESDENSFKSEVQKTPRRLTENRQVTRENYCTFIDKAWRILVEQMNPRVLLDEFRTIEYFPPTVQRDIEETFSTSEANRNILKHVRLKGPSGYLRFKECVAQSNQTNILNVLDNIDGNLQAAYTERRESCRIVKHLPEKWKDIRHDLINYYSKEFSTLLLSPIIDEYDAPISHFYTQPTLLLKKFGSVDNQTSKPLSSYKDLFTEDSKLCKNIYITSDAGVGKTTYVKRMVLAWCQAHENVAENGKHFQEEDLKLLKSFDFLFIISLRDYSKKECIVERMLHDQMKRICPLSNAHEELKDILRKGNCLIILDGLDEWSHPTSGECILVSEIPHRYSFESSTLLTLTRTWKIDAAKLRTNDIDKQIELTEIDRTSAQVLIRKVTEHLNKRQGREKCSKDFECMIEMNSLEEISSNPLILMQLICEWHDGNLKEKTQCEVYIKIIELLLNKAETRFIMTDVENIVFQNIQAIDCFKFSHVFRKYPKYIMALGELSFETLFGENQHSSLVFDQTTTERYLTKEYMQFSFDTGILRKWKVHGKLTSRTYCTSFLHRKYQEFFAAFHIAAHVSKPDRITSKIHKFCTSLKSMLEMYQVFIFLSGLESEITAAILKRFSEVLCNDSTFKQYRKCVRSGHYQKTCIDRVMKYQMTILKCIEECEVCHMSSQKDNKCQIIKKLNHLLYLTIADESSLIMKHMPRNYHDLNSLHVHLLNQVCNGSMRSLHKIQIRGGNPRQMVMPLCIYKLIENASSTMRCLQLESYRFMNNITSIIQKLTDLVSLSLSKVYMDHTERIVLMRCLSENTLPRLEQLELHNIKCYIRRYSMNELNLNISNCFQLQHLSLRSLPISKIDFPNHGNLKHLCLDQLPLEQVDLAKLEKLEYLELSDLQITEVDASMNTEVQHLQLSNLQLPDLELSKLTQLQDLIVKNVPIRKMVVSEQSGVQHCNFENVPVCKMEVSIINISQNVANVLVGKPLLPEWTHLSTFELTGTALGDKEIKLSSRLESLQRLNFKKVSMNMNVLLKLVEVADRYKQSVHITLFDCDVEPRRDFGAFKNHIRETGHYEVTKDVEASLNEFCFRRCQAPFNK